MADLACAREEDFDDFEEDFEGDFRSVCEGPVDNEHDGKHYCVLHAPTKDKNLATFEGAIEKKLKDKDFDFRGVYFPGQRSLVCIFQNATFEGTVDFSYATFEGDADFTGATFEGDAYFYNDTFKKWADFSYATFEGEGRNFYKATFGEGANFYYATFKGEADFSNATFEGRTYLDNAIFKEVAKFWSLRTSSQTHLSFGSAVIEKPERLSFHSTQLRPSWFIDVDAQKFDFSDVEWFRLPDGEELKLEKEIEATEDQGFVSPSSLRKLQKACRQLMNNAEENRDYPPANEFHYWSMELLRKEGWRRLGLIGTLYWALSGYGERPRRAFLVLVGMGTLFAILYVMVAGSIEHVGQAFLYSLAAMVRLTGVPAMAPLTKLLQPSEPGLFQFLVTAEGILGPLQIALLALAVRRKVMR